VADGIVLIDDHQVGTFVIEASDRDPSAAKQQIVIEFDDDRNVKTLLEIASEHAMYTSLHLLIMPGLGDME
jgi:hypothetical protein